MGCCAGLKNDNIFDKEYIVNLGPKEIDDLVESDRDFQKNNEKREQRRSSSKTAERNGKRRRILASWQIKMLKKHEEKHFNCINLL